jgi:hypothetical protein
MTHVAHYILYNELVFYSSVVFNQSIQFHTMRRLHRNFQSPHFMYSMAFLHLSRGVDENL